MISLVFNMSIFVVLSILVLYSQVNCEVTFKSVPITVKALENDTVLLPCYIDETEPKLRVRWYKDGVMLGDSADAGRLLPRRTRMLANYSLQINTLAGEDTALYTCEIVRPEPWGSINQTHKIQVQTSPTIRTIPEDGFVEVKKGEFIDIGCNATGTPQPLVSWRKDGQPMALLEARARLKFKAEHRRQAAVYHCSAANGVGAPATADIVVVVHDAPEVSAQRSFVHTAVGLRAELAAIVEFSSPPAKTAWYRDGRAVKTDDRVVMMVQDNVHKLIFRLVRLPDLGNYTFRAENSLGMADVSFKLTGVPNAASFKVDAALNKPSPTTFTLIWEVDSYSTINEYNLWIRPYYGRPANSEESNEPSPNKFSKIVVPGDSGYGPIHSESYTVKGLTPSTVYEAIVTSRNSFGWSKQSSVLHFATGPGTGRMPSTVDYSDITPYLEQTDPEPHNITQAKMFVTQTSFGTQDRPSMSAFLILASILVFGDYS